ncbi:PREDICTED: NADH dehydrogenase [ubiquinone] 1 alpha subcomplex subunit 8 [Trachymyrmex septentrionalis]|uniref:NADH dehydrogenase [ubiquinone] 1 alpha subcomplex subunit 8 n=1 Tax=Trachymyrmex septentrionalis TaxID=34720 RepID=UPI00084F41E6|nr:PREDICTED: NADH dehydrogenase [ubiquinone] 1 alpha subcomplex subunit 8 [Trachymyrmex septentrionalis]
MATAKTVLPEESELTVQELNVSWPVLQTASVYIGKGCEWYNNEFLLCRQEERDPRRCLNEGKAVTSCALDILKKMKKHCLEDFNAYMYCLERSSGTLEFAPCRKTQAALDNCVRQNLNIERPPYGYFCEAKVHNTSRPRPEPEKPITFPDPTPGLPSDVPLEKSKYSNRMWYKS